MDKNTRKYFISPDATVRQAIEKIQDNGRKTAFIVDADEKLLGIFTDGDMRRFVLKNGNLQSKVTEAMNPNPIVFKENQKEELDKQLKERGLLAYPVVNDTGQIIKVVYWDNKEDIIHPSQELPENTAVIIMAGGEGTRLYPYTKILPKPLIPIGELPICTRIINSFKKFNCKNFNLILNHKSNMIKAYYNDTEKDYSLNYFTEKEFLGTAGGLALLKGTIKDTCFVSNCDILIDTDYSCIYKWHKKEKNLISMVCAIKEMQIPYGVIHSTEAGSIKNIKEKPSYSFLVNTGVYLIEPQVIDNLRQEFLHMPNLAQQYIKKGLKVGVFPVSSGDWLDMGQLEELENMSEKLSEKFKKG
ncbi:MAG: CBS domain-containing protein [Endomicrobium sp.]|jgi:dTDP-glucose pyrophosphorylase|nr:CBS domain-containing protein [Endomicrobium sp.]